MKTSIMRIRSAERPRSTVSVCTMLARSSTDELSGSRNDVICNGAEGVGQWRRRTHAGRRQPSLGVYRRDTVVTTRPASSLAHVARAAPTSLPGVISHQ